MDLVIATYVGNTMNELEELKLGTLFIHNSLLFFFTRESRSRLGAKVLMCGNAGTDKKIVKISWNKSSLGSNTRIFMPSI
jgi:hypothetical protein